MPPDPVPDPPTPVRALRIAALVKQVPVGEDLVLGDDGRLARYGVALEMSAYCRRAVAQGVALAAATSGTCTVLTMGPPSARDVLREAIAFGADAGLHLCDPAFAGADTLATARALSSALAQHGPFDLVLAGRASLDAETGQVGPQVAELLGLPFAAGVRTLALTERDATIVVRAGLEHDDLWLDVELDLPAVVSTAERLIDPCKIKDPARWRDDDGDRIVTVDAASLGPGPWGADGSPTWVGEVRTEAVARERRRLAGPVVDQVDEAVAWLEDRGLLGGLDGPGPSEATSDEVHGLRAAHPLGAGAPLIAVVGEPERPRAHRELVAAATRLALGAGARVVDLVVTDAPRPASDAAGRGISADAGLGVVPTDEVVWLRGSTRPDDVAAWLIGFCVQHRPWAVLAPSSEWGREVASRVAARLGAGLTGDAVGLTVDGDRLVGWKPAFGGSLVAAVRSRSDIQLVTVRPGVLPVPPPGGEVRLAWSEAALPVTGRVRLVGSRRDDDTEALAAARVVVGVGQGVDPDGLHRLDGLLEVLGAELVATRKVTDQGWLPRARQVGITGLSLAPALYVAIGTSGRFNHMAGVRSAGAVLAINHDVDAPVFDVADLGIVGDWREAVAALDAALRARSPAP